MTTRSKKKTTRKKANSKRLAGRPTKYTPEKGDKICEMVAEGKSASAACKEVGIALKNMYGWLRAHESFRSNYEIARQDAADTLVDELMLIADTEEDVQRAKLKIDARKWVAARMKPKSWGDKQDLNVGVQQSLSDVMREIGAKSALDIARERSGRK